jgi:Beta/Gamma crystallin
MRNKIDSIEVHGPVRVILFDEPNFQGRRLIVEDDTFDLDDFNFGNHVESMIIERIN